MRGYLIAAAAGAAVALVLLVMRNGGTPEDGLSPRDLAGGAVEMIVEAGLFMGAWWLWNRQSR